MYAQKLPEEKPVANQKHQGPSEDGINLDVNDGYDD